MGNFFTKLGELLGTFLLRSLLLIGAITCFGAGIYLSWAHTSEFATLHGLKDSLSTAYTILVEILLSMCEVAVIFKALLGQRTHISVKSGMAAGLVINLSANVMALSKYGTIGILIGISIPVLSVVSAWVFAGALVKQIEKKNKQVSLFGLWGQKIKSIFTPSFSVISRPATIPALETIPDEWVEEVVAEICEKIKETTIEQTVAPTVEPTNSMKGTSNKNELLGSIVNQQFEEPATVLEQPTTEIIPTEIASTENNDLLTNSQQVETPITTGTTVSKEKGTKKNVPVTAPSLATEKETKRVLEIAKQHFEATGKRPGRDKLVELAKCSGNRAREVLVLLKKQEQKNHQPKLELVK